MPRKQRKKTKRQTKITTAQPAKQGFRSLELSNDLFQNKFVANRWFYTLPEDLWVSLRNAIGVWVGSSELLKLDADLAAHADAIGGCVGFRDGQPISDPLLRPTPSMSLDNPFMETYLKECRDAGFNVAGIEQLMENTIPGLERPRQAYAGWLFTSPTFLSEYRHLQEQHADLFPATGAPPQPIAPTNSDAAPQRLKPDDDATSRAVNAFCERWRLSRLVGPATVVPKSLQFPVPSPQLSAAQAQTSGSLLYIPDITPLPDRNTLRQLLGQTVQQTTAKSTHLQEWFDLVQHDTQGKQPIARYARWYPLQHYLRVLYSRHAELLTNRQNKVERLIGKHIGLNEDQLRRDLRDIKDRLGKDWFRPHPVAATAS